MVPVELAVSQGPAQVPVITLVPPAIEGAEVQGLKGALEVLMQYRPTVFLSVHPRQIVALGYSTSELRQIIDEIGYQVWDIAKNEVCHGNLGFGEFRLERIAEVRSL